MGRRIEKADAWFARPIHEQPRRLRHTSAPAQHKTEDTNKPKTTRFDVPPFEIRVGDRWLTHTSSGIANCRGASQTYFSPFSPRGKKLLGRRACRISYQNIAARRCAEVAFRPPDAPPTPAVLIRCHRPRGGSLGPLKPGQSAATTARRLDSAS
jgi:hypothetical protein